MTDGDLGRLVNEYGGLVVRRHVVGVAVYASADGSRHHASFGTASTEGPPIDEHVVFEAGSVTKTFTALLLAEMVMRHEISLETSVGEVLGHRRAPTTGAITMAELASHTSGLPAMPSNAPRRRSFIDSIALVGRIVKPRRLLRQLTVDAARQFDGYTTELLVSSLVDDRLRLTARGRYRYSNYGYGLLGHLLGVIADTDYPTLLAARILEPLGMTDTKIGFPSSSPRATGHGADLVPVADFPFRSALSPAGGLCTSATDLGRYLGAHLQPDQSPFPAPIGLVEAIQTTRRHVRSGVGLGWHHDRGAWWHNGGTEGHQSYLGYHRERVRSVAVLSNTLRLIPGAGIERPARNFLGQWTMPRIPGIE